MRGFSIRQSIRHIFVLCVAFLTATVVAQAQQPKKVPRIGYLGTNPRSTSSARIEAFRQG